MSSCYMKHDSQNEAINCIKDSLRELFDCGEAKEGDFGVVFLATGNTAKYILGPRGGISRELESGWVTYSNTCIHVSKTVYDMV